MSGNIFLGALLLMGPRPGPQARVTVAEADRTRKERRLERMFMVEVRMTLISSGHQGTFLHRPVLPLTPH